MNNSDTQMLVDYLRRNFFRKYGNGGWAKFAQEALHSENKKSSLLEFVKALNGKKHKLSKSHFDEIQDKVISYASSRINEINDSKLKDVISEEKLIKEVIRVIQIPEFKKLLIEGIKIIQKEVIMFNTLLINPKDYEKELRSEAIKVGKEHLLQEYVVLYDRVHNASSENPCDITDERELQEVEYMLDYLEGLDPSNVPF